MSFKPIAAAICFSLALFLLLFMVWPKYQHLQDLNNQIEATKTQLEQSKEYISRLGTLSDRLEKKDKAVEKVKSALPDKPNVPSLLNFLANTGQNHGMSIKSIGSITQSSYKGDIEKVDVVVEMVGTYSSFRNFVRGMEKSSRIIDLQTIDFQMPDRDEEQEEKKLPEFDLKLSTYFYPSQ